MQGRKERLLVQKLDVYLTFEAQRMPELAGEGRGAWPLVTEEMFWERREREGSNFASTYLNGKDDSGGPMM